MALLEARGLSRTFPGSDLPALEGVNVAFHAGESVGIVGESGSGKTTLARLLVGSDSPTAGTVTYQGQPIPTHGAAFRSSRRDLQLLPQHASGALNPRLTVQSHFDEVISAHHLGTGKQRTSLTADRLREVRLDPHLAETYPRRLSGGQQQRVVIARGLLLDPTVMICDEPTSALDALTQGEILDVLRARCITESRLFMVITHDLSVAARLCTRIVVLQRGRIVEDRPAADLLADPLHPYTRQLLSASAVDS